MFLALARWIKAFGYLMTGQLDAARRTLDSNPHVVRAKYDEVIRDKTSRIHQYKQAVAQLITQQEMKLGKIKALTDDVQRLQNLKAGALAKARQRVKELTAAGRSPEEVQLDEDYRKSQTAYQDFESTLAEKQARIEELETDVADYTKRIAEHKVQLQGLLRDLEKIRSEQADAVADFITAREEKEIADTISGIAKDGTAEELQRLRTLRQEVKAEARVSKELAGTDSRAQEEEFLAYARRDAAASAFAELVGLPGEPASPETAKPERDKPSELPE